MEITEQLLRQKRACEEGIAWFLQNGLDGAEHPEVIAQAARHNIDWAVWAIDAFRLSDITEVSDDEGHRCGWEWDERGRPLRKYEWKYDTKGSLLRKTEEDIRCHILWEWEYDGNGSLLRERLYRLCGNKGLPLREWEYDGNGSLLRESEYDHRGIPHTE